MNVIRATGKLPVKYKMKLYRGRPDVFCEMRAIYYAGRVCWWTAFTSCSTDINAAAHMAGPSGCALELQCDKVHDISEMPFFPEEKEMLLPPNTKWVPQPAVRAQPIPAAEGSPEQQRVMVISLIQILTGEEIVS